MYSHRSKLSIEIQQLKIKVDESEEKLLELGECS